MTPTPDPAAPLPPREPCDECHGTGEKHPARAHMSHEVRDCEECGGSGQRDQPKARLLGGPLRVMWEPVPGREVDVTEHFMLATSGRAALDIALGPLYEIREREVAADRHERRLPGGPLPYVR